MKDLFKEETALLREKLLAVNGIGPETADSILLYAAGKPVFVVDAYTRRIFSRIGLVPPDASYTDVQRYVFTRMKPRANVFNEFHALLVELAKRNCRIKPICGNCPLSGDCKKVL